MKRKVNRIGEGVNLIFISFRRNVSYSLVSTGPVLSYDRSEAELGQYCSFGSRQLHVHSCTRIREVLAY